MSLHQTVYTFCMSERSLYDQVYKRCSMAIDRHLREDLFPTLRGQRGIILLNDLLIEWKKHKVLGKWIGSIFASVDRYYAEMFQLVPLKDSTLASFRLLIVSPLMDSVREALLDAMRKDRQEGITQDALVVVKNTNELLVEISKNKRSLVRRRV